MTGFLSPHVQLCAEIAKNYFSIETLTEAQQQVLELWHKESYVLATLPTGSGKTLLYALPALAQPDEGPILVLSPLIALMRNQTQRLEEGGCVVSLFTSEQSQEERQQAWKLLRINAHIVLASPERLLVPGFLEQLKQCGVRRVVVDEAHCVVSWGHDFRPEYADISRLLQPLEAQKILALTATASPSSCARIAATVFSQPERVSYFRKPPLSATLFLESHKAISLDDKQQRLLHALERSGSQKTVVYFSTRLDCEKYASYLRAKHYNALHYHAGLDKNERMRVEEQFMNSKRSIVLCTTSAFGMGIDIPHIGLVIVYGFPTNMEEFFQMIGRAGRRNQPGHSLLLWSSFDVGRRQYQLNKQYPAAAHILSCVRAVAGHLLPKHSKDVVYMQQKDILAVWQKAFPTPTDDRSQLLEPTLAVLRLLGGMVSVTPRKSYCLLECHKKISWQDLLHPLGAEPSKRRWVLQTLSAQIPAVIWKKKGSSWLIAYSDICEIMGPHVSWCETVLNHYAHVLYSDWACQKTKKPTQQTVLRYTHLTPQSANEHLFFKKNLQFIEDNIGIYTQTREDFLCSFRQLVQLALAQQCNVRSSLEFFLSPERGTQLLCSAKMDQPDHTDEPFTQPPVQTHGCGQCHVCVPEGRLLS